MDAIVWNKQLAMKALQLIAVERRYTPLAQHRSGALRYERNCCELGLCVLFSLIRAVGFAGWGCELARGLCCFAVGEMRCEIRRLRGEKYRCTCMHAAN
jgi:hypothetical protein